MRSSKRSSCLGSSLVVITKRVLHGTCCSREIAHRTRQKLRTHESSCRFSGRVSIHRSALLPPESPTTSEARVARLFLVSGLAMEGKNPMSDSNTACSEQLVIRVTFTPAEL